MVGEINVVTNWLLISSLYAIIAIGFTMIFGIGNVLNLFHGASITIGAYMAHFIYASGYSPELALIGGLLVPGIVNGALYVGAITHIMDRPVTVMVITLILSVVVEEIILVFVGATPRVVPALFSGQTQLLGISVQSNRLFVFGLSWAIILGLLYFINNMKAGKAIMATSMTKKGAAIVGIDNEDMLLYTWVLAGVLAGAGGVFLASFQTATYNMGLDPLVLSFTIVVVGGLGSIRGSIIGAYLIGGIETVMTSYVSPELNGLASLVVLAVILLVKPEGLFGRELVESE